MSDEKAAEKADIVQLLIQHGADVTARDNTRSTSLHLASSKGSGKTAELLLKHVANFDAQDERHSTPLHLAVSSRLDLKLEGQCRAPATWLQCKYKCQG